MTHEFEPLLRKAIAGLGPADRAARDVVYERVRQTLVRQLQASGRTDAEIDQELEAFLQAVARVEKDAAGEPEYTPPPRPRAGPPASPAATLEASVRRVFPLMPVAIAGVVVAALAAASIVYLLSPRGSTPAAPPPRTEAPAPKTVAATPAPAAKDQPASAARPASAPPVTATKAASEETASYWLRRQRVFYRTTHPPGTIVVSLNQRFLYVVQPNQVAIRYAIGIGPACNNASGLFRITDKIARATPPGPQVTKDAWFDPPALYFDKGRAVHEATEPGRIGQSATAGCFQSWDQDIADLFERIAVNERVVIAN